MISLIWNGSIATRGLLDGIASSPDQAGYRIDMGPTLGLEQKLHFRLSQFDFAHRPVLSDPQDIGLLFSN